MELIVLVYNKYKEEKDEITDCAYIHPCSNIIVTRLMSLILEETEDREVRMQNTTGLYRGSLRNESHSAQHNESAVTDHAT